ERLVVGDVAFRALLPTLAEREPEGATEFAELDAAEQDREVDAGTEQEHDHRGAPDQCARAAEPELDRVHPCFSSGPWERVDPVGAGPLDGRVIERCMHRATGWGGRTQPPVQRPCEPVY